MVTEPIDQVLELLPNGALIVLAASVGLGVILALLGRKLAKGAVALGGLLVGAGVGAAAASLLSLGGGWMAIACVVLGAILGVAASSLLFRVWMAICGAILASVVVPAAVLIWQGTPPPEPIELSQASQTLSEQAVATGSENAQGLLDSIKDKITGQFTGEENSDADPTANQETDDESSNTPPKLGLPSLAPAQLTDEQKQQIQAELTAGAQEAASAVWGDVESRIRDWWDQSQPGTRNTVWVGAAGGALGGVAVGLILPNTTASILSAVLGAVLIWLPGLELLRRLQPAMAEDIPTGARPTLVAIGLITAAAIAIQWTLFRKDSD